MKLNSKLYMPPETGREKMRFYRVRLGIVKGTLVKEE